MDKFELDGLMQKIQRGDEDAFERLYNGTRYGLHSFVMSICKNYHTAEDIMQSTYVRVRLSAKSYEVGSNALAWIYTIAKNIALNELNKQKREVLNEMESSRFGEYTIDDKVDDTLSIVMAKALNDTERQIITLHVVAGFKHREIAEMLQMPLGSVLWSYQNAIKKMKKELEENS